jgi:hypothetical protein
MTIMSEMEAADEDSLDTIGVAMKLDALSRDTRGAKTGRTKTSNTCYIFLTKVVFCGFAGMTVRSFRQIKKIMKIDCRNHEHKCI